MNFASYGAETVYNLEELVKSVQHLCRRMDSLVEIEQELLGMQREMFEDYRKAKDRAHVKLQGDTEGNHATPGA